LQGFDLNGKLSLQFETPLFLSKQLILFTYKTFSASTKEHLGKSYELGDARQIKLMALDDEDLKPLWEAD